MSVSQAAPIRNLLPASIAALAIGVFLLVCVAAAQGDDTPGNEAPAPKVARTAYVEFGTLLREDKLLKRKQQELAEMLEITTIALENESAPLIEDQRRIRSTQLPSTREYRQAMRKQLELETSLYEAKLGFEQQTQKDLKNFAIERFKALRNLVRDIALEKGYTEVLNIAGDAEKVEAAEDFQALQQQLLVSPVLYYEPANNITPLVLAKAEELWGEHITLGELELLDDKGAPVAVKEEPVPDQLDSEGKPVMRRVVELRLGQVYNVKVQVKDRGTVLAADAPRASVRWSRFGTGTGTIDDVGRYSAPAEWPKDDREFVIRARSAIDPTVSREVYVRLLDKDGKPRPPKE